MTDLVEAIDGVAEAAPSTEVPALRPMVRLALVAEAAGGGVAVHLADLVRGLRSHGGFEIHLLVPQGARCDASILDANVLAQCDSVQRLPMQRAVGAADTVAFAHLFRCLQRLDPDIVHSHSSKAGALARLCFGRWKQVYTPHAVYTLNPYLPRGQRRFYGLIERWLGRLASDRLIAVSLDEAEHLQHALRIPAARIATILNGVPAPALLPRAQARDELGLPHDAVVVGFVGRLDFQKGVDRLVRIARTLRARGIDHVVFAVIGPGDFQAAAGVSESAIPDNVRVLGAVPDARRYFSAFDIFALPSRYEGFPYVVLEAMAAHVPIVATRVSGAAELIAAESIGLVVSNQDDITPFADALAVLSQDRLARERMSRNGERAAARFSAGVMVERTVDLYHRLLDEAHSCCK
ncbi:glycosyltransferase [Paraburkholderia sp. BCC1886]|uniref:glycosyltransferase n=1 Tax=Paraburkholderia sp. BCC1886 TaxID=2562670 RepID=UPI0021B20ABF|nr:glycosyltransferase [Paraburkholderia sp. BCC1886]